MYDIAGAGQQLPALAGPISGRASVCGSERFATYSVPEVKGADSLVWRLTSDDPVYQWDTTTVVGTVGITFPEGIESAYLSVRGKNQYGYGVARWLWINPIIDEIPTPKVNARGNVLISSALEGNQWNNEDGMIEGATDRVFTATESGTYYTIVSLYGCTSDTSNQVEVIPSGVDLIQDVDGFSAYPNPVARELNITCNGESGNRNLEIVNLTGRIVFQSQFNGRAVVPTTQFSPGIYLVKVTSRYSCRIKKVIKR